MQDDIVEFGMPSPSANVVKLSAIPSPRLLCYHSHENDLREVA